MRRFAFVIFMLGMFFLVLHFNRGAIEVSDVEGLSKLGVNERVLVEGSVVNERIIYGETRIIELDDGIRLICECGGFLGEEIEFEGVVEEYEWEKQVRVLKIRAEVKD